MKLLTSVALHGKVSDSRLGRPSSRGWEGARREGDRDLERLGDLVEWRGQGIERLGDLVEWQGQRPGSASHCQQRGSLHQFGSKSLMRSACSGVAAAKQLAQMLLLTLVVWQPSVSLNLQTWSGFSIPWQDATLVALARKHSRASFGAKEWLRSDREMNQQRGRWRGRWRG